MKRIEVKDLNVAAGKACICGGPCECGWIISSATVSGSQVLATSLSDNNTPDAEIS